MKSTILFLVFFILLFSAGPGYGLTPDETVVLVNRNGRHSIGLGKYYMKKRNIPEENMLRLWTTDKERITREDYEKQIAAPVKEFIEEKAGQGRNIRCLVLMYGMPLRIRPPGNAQNDKEGIDSLKNQKESIEKSLAELDKKSPAYKKEIEDLRKVKKELKFYGIRNSREASLESELSLLMIPDYSLEGWVVNPLFKLQDNPSPIGRKKIFFVSRLDGPDQNTVRRIIKDSIEAEKTGLKGNAYFDARWKAPKKSNTKKLTGYNYYDWSLHQAAAFFKDENIMPVVLDDNNKLFQKGEAPNAAIYCGWYSLGRYVDAFKWQPGAIGYHIASIECESLKAKNNRWCPNVLSKGAAVTIGPVSEPFVTGFPVPELFFKLLTEGRYSLVECYYLSLPLLSWKMVLIGDPLYRPFKKRFDAIH